jgi:hypothetical protein
VPLFRVELTTVLTTTMTTVRPSRHLHLHDTRIRIALRSHRRPVLTDHRFVFIRSGSAVPFESGALNPENWSSSSTLTSTSVAPLTSPQLHTQKVLQPRAVKRHSPRPASDRAQRWCGACQGPAATRSAPGRALTATAPPRERPLPARGVCVCCTVARCGDHVSLTISSSFIRRLWSRRSENQWQP